MNGMTLKPIGTVKNALKESPGSGYNWENEVSEIILEDDLIEALDNLDEFSHIIVLWWMHKGGDTTRLPSKTHPRGKKELPLVGRFATRSPHRPNPIGKATVRLIERDGNMLKVQGLDTIDGTPVIDIKPYLPGYDSVPDAKVPSWVVKR